MNTNSELRSLTDEEVDAVAGAKGSYFDGTDEVALLELIIPACRSSDSGGVPWAVTV
jgi:hypothetical protein